MRIDTPTWPVIRGVLVSGGIVLLGAKAIARGQTWPGSVAIAFAIVLFAAQWAGYRWVRRVAAAGAPAPGGAVAFTAVQTAITVGFLIVIGATLLR